ncbi:CTP synthase [Candidatus Uhrbacteria bacterium RIFCSPLOWO2_01_FULL_47_24]|uniref:CTP synthase n=1 Tax=Candidatus Uhrbacteria bacterium RIFCSPLOWO2_01_FULL_47_24 TaxID=1802401 RepID=A0A1F7UP45_9BACT|nr:MAG: CTP synthase [Candidatus Uhrbacteria bacterium RIFCSPHIGHO2_01_FULL_47_11]OGL68277.1 MAG: CTP synthase [Candidatus Uhrbacteria bacterium RIFCSPHIGHO2_02_FULL_46_47]OGL76992.1 MAG: CTP synthase [Candidatus Uhrbacteria bacterium RIFCSPHIGHO2_12_FULL_47_11]OGL80015.1 MAG: CTP synthase [Candidatus Uhrbacteria bacterium RIFCSPLOWO2_01_FULL_47_24]OGL85213.1 MAG: CTP synthase [Candidatus Uhrbacteria bacterium RIFCSPLOWO2_02_FULL_46_25]OGL91542.1 MAG: CTP synthase [Candidatus Uhrbacteria bacte
MSKFIFVVGGVMSGVGKGTAAASIGKILQSKGFEVTAIKIDPYINVDAGTMNPVEHGEVFVTDDGDETDQDIGNYERFLDRSISSDNYMTTGRVYQTVIERERNLEYGGRCVEVVPDIPNEVIRRIERATKKAKADITIVEIGGTVGEYQNVLFLEAGRMMKLAHPKDVLFVLVSYLPVPGALGEMKTKPTQTAARLLNSAGIQPDFVLARAPQAIDEPRRRKLAIFCNVQAEDVISAPDAASTYEVPLNFEHDKLGEKILKKLGLKSRGRDMKEWQKLVDITRTARRGVRVGIVGKYFTTGGFILSDAYISVIEAIKHAAWHHKRKPILTWIDAEEYEKNPRKLSELKKFDGVIVPGGFGGRGVEGKIAAIGYARTNKIPFLGLCYGMQLATVEFARNVARLKGSVHTGEVEPKARHQVIHIMPEQEKLMLAHLPAFGGKYGGTMRLGAYPCLLNRQSRAYKAYGKELVSERHRHRFEVNNSYREILQKAGLMIAGTSPDGKLVEIIEVSKHPFFVGTQFHPEFKSRPLAPHPLFRDFIAAAMVGKK